MKKIKKGISLFYQEIFSHFSRKTGVPLEVLVKLELGGYLKVLPIIDFVLDNAFSDEVKFGKGSLEERLKNAGERFGATPVRVVHAIKRMGHTLPKHNL